MFAGDCNTNYIEVKSGSDKGRVLKKFCTDTQPSGKFKTYASQVYIHFVKGALTSSFSGTWTTEDVTCCSKVSVENQVTH